MNTQNDISQEELEKIERYVMRRMDIVEKEAFEVRLENDSAFAEKVSRTKTVLSTIKKEALRNKLDGFHNEVEIIKELKITNFKSSRYKRHFALAAVASIAAIFTLYMFSSSKNSNDQLFNQFYVADPGLPNLMSLDDNYIFDDAMVDFKQGNYSIAFEKWKTQLPQKPDNDTLNYFLGVSRLSSGASKDAIPYLIKTVEIDDSTFVSDAYFYLGLAHLKQDNVKAAKAALERSTMREAKELLEELKR